MQPNIKIRHDLGWSIKNCGVLLKRAPTSTQLILTSTQHHSPPSSSFQPPTSSLNLIRTKMPHEIGNFPKFSPKNLKLFILTENWHSWYLWGADSEPGLRFLKFWPQNSFWANWAKNVMVVPFAWKLAHMVSRGCWFLFRH